MYYRWAPRINASVSAAKAAREFQRIKKIYGTINVLLIIAYSRSWDAVLHYEFFWGDGERAQAAREQRATQLFKGLRLVRHTKKCRDKTKA